MFNAIGVIHVFSKLGRKQINSSHFPSMGNGVGQTLVQTLHILYAGTLNQHPESKVEPFTSKQPFHTEELFAPTPFTPPSIF